MPLAKPGHYRCWCADRFTFLLSSPFVHPLRRVSERGDNRTSNGHVYEDSCSRRILEFGVRSSDATRSPPPISSYRACCTAKESARKYHRLAQRPSSGNDVRKKI